MKNLSKKKIIINNLFRSFGNVSYSDFSELFPKGTRVESISSNPRADYYIVQLGKNERLVCGKNSITEIRRVERGIFEGCACLIEVERRFEPKTRISVVHDEGVFKFPVLDTCPSSEQLDNMFETESIQEVLAEGLNTFDITKRIQSYVFLCEGMPKNIWENDEFVGGVRNKLQAKRVVTLIGDVDRRFINEEECRSASQECLSSLIDKKEKEKTLC